MDVFEELLRGVRVDRAMLGRSVHTPPWAIRFAHVASVSIGVLLRGSGWLQRDGGGPRRLQPGDVAVVRGGCPFVVADELTTPLDVTVHGPDSCTSDGLDVRAQRSLGPRTWGERPDGRVLLLVGSYQVVHPQGARLVEALAPVAVVPASGPDPALDLLAAETGRDGPGQPVVLDRLLDLLLVRTLRAWFARADAAAPGWYRALTDPVLGPAMRALHDAPERPWTVAAIAAEAGISRAALARRFTEVVGEPPMAYLTARRMELAEQLLAEPGSTVAAVARRVGYADPFGFSVAFKRLRGRSPGTVRPRRGPAGAVRRP